MPGALGCPAFLWPALHSGTGLQAEAEPDRFCAQTDKRTGAKDMPVLGIGGVFFRAKDPEALTAWYDRHLRVGSGHDGSGTKNEGDWFWQVQAGPVVFAPFKAATDYWPAGKEFLLNFRVSGLDALLASLRTANIDVETRAEWDTPETGRFARIYDPEGNPIELWEPPAGG